MITGVDSVPALPATDAAVRIPSEDAFRPPGTQIHEYTSDGVMFGIWAANLSNPVAKQLLRNMQIMVPMFIEGGTLLELDDPDWTIERWTIFFV